MSTQLIKINSISKISFPWNVMGENSESNFTIFTIHPLPSINNGSSFKRVYIILLIYLLENKLMRLDSKATSLCHTYSTTPIK